MSGRIIEAESGPIELNAVYIPAELAACTDVGRVIPLPGGVLTHLTERTGIKFDHATERISARLPTTEELKLLRIDERSVVLTRLITLFDRADLPQLVIDAVIPASRHELEDSFPLH